MSSTTESVLLSASSINTFLRCGYQWYLAYVERVREPPSLKQVLGIATHDAVEVNMRQKLTSHIDLPVADVLDAYSDSFDAQVREVEVFTEKPGAVKDDGVRLVSLYQRTVAPPIQPYWVERPIRFMMGGIEYTGYLDLVDERETPLGPIRRIRDTKTTARRPTGSSYAIAMSGYALGYRAETGDVEDEVILDYLVRTKTPQYIPISSGGQVSDESLDAFAGISRTIAAAIEAGSFIYNGLYSGACSWCGYKERCPGYRGTKTFAP